MWTLNQNDIGEAAQNQVVESAAFMKALQKLQKEQAKVTATLRKVRSFPLFFPSFLCYCDQLNPPIVAPGVGLQFGRDPQPRS